MGNAKFVATARGWLLAPTVTLALALALLAGPVVAGGSLGPATGDRVLAQWEPDGYWYPARITAIAGREISVDFDDGDVAVVGAFQVRDFDWHAGSRLQCNWRGEGRYFEGTVDVLQGDRVDFLYDDGDRETRAVGRCRSG